jgi:hypothetical protein
MSYFCIENIISEDKENKAMNETPSNVEKKKRDHRNERNPHFGHIMSQESRDKISNTQRNRYEMINKLVRRGMHQMTEERVKEICGEVIDEYFQKNVIEVKQNNKKPMNINL